MRWFIKLILYFIILSTGQTLVATFCLLSACFLLACLLLLAAASCCCCCRCCCWCCCCCCCCAAAAASCCCCFLLLLLLLPPPPPAAAAASSCCCCRWCKHFAENQTYSLGRLVTKLERELQVRILGGVGRIVHFFSFGMQCNRIPRLRSKPIALLAKWAVQTLDNIITYVRKDMRIKVANMLSKSKLYIFRPFTDLGTPAHPPRVWKVGILQEMSRNSIIPDIDRDNCLASRKIFSAITLAKHLF